MLIITFMKRINHLDVGLSDPIAFSRILSDYSFNMADMSSCRSILIAKDLFDEEGKARLLPKSIRNKAVIVECEEVDNGMPF